MIQLQENYRYLILGLTAICLSGCAAYNQNAMLPETRSLGSSYESIGRPVYRDISDEFAEGTNVFDVLHMEAALALALLHNPELEAYSYDVRAAEARMVQAGTWPNPELEVEVDDYNHKGEGYDSAINKFKLKQMLVLGGKRYWHKRMAKADGALSGWEYEMKRLDVFTETARTFIRAHAAQRALALAQSALELAKQTDAAVRERVDAGKEPLLQAAKAAAELDLSRLELFKAENELKIAYEQLTTMWGDAPVTFKYIEGDLDTVAASIPDLALLEPHLIENPQLERWDDVIELHSSQLSAAKAARIPDVKAVVGYQYHQEDKSDAMMFGVEFPLPLFDRNKGNIEAARYTLARAHAERRVVQVALKADLVEAYSRLTAAHRQATTLQMNVVPTIQMAFDIAQEGYRQGKFSFLDVLDAQRTLFEGNQKLVHALMSYHTARRTIEGLIGTELLDLEETQEEKF